MIYKRCGNWLCSNAYLILIPFTSEKLTEKKIEIYWNLWQNKKYTQGVWWMLPTIRVNGKAKNFVITFNFLKIMFQFQWFNWSHPDNKL